MTELCWFTIRCCVIVVIVMLIYPTLCRVAFQIYFKERRNSPHG